MTQLKQADVNDNNNDNNHNHNNTFYLYSAFLGTQRCFTGVQQQLHVWGGGTLSTGMEDG